MRTVWQRVRARYARKGFVGFVSDALTVSIGIMVNAIAIVLFWDGWHARADKAAAVGISEGVQWLIFGVVVIIMIVAMASIIVNMLREGNEEWRLNLIRGLAFLLLVFVFGAIIWPDRIGTPDDSEHDDAAEAGARAVPDVGASSVELPEAERMRREALILAAYDELLANPSAAIATIQRVRTFRALTTEFAEANGLDLLRVEAIIAQESHGDPNVTSDKGARGLMQLMDETAIAYGEACGIADPEQDSHDPRANICTGSTYLASLVAEFGGDGETALARYNWSGKYKQADGGVLDVLAGTRSFWLIPPEYVPEQTQHYVPGVLAWELAARSFDQSGTLGEIRGVAGPHLASAGSLSGTAHGNASAPIVIIIRDAEASESGDTPEPTDVWYTFREGESYDRTILELFRDSSETIFDLNEARSIADRRNLAGQRLYLPESRFAFYRPSGSETYHDIATRHEMTLPQLLRWSGRWSSDDEWAALSRECPSEGCSETLEVASASTELLVKRR